MSPESPVLSPDTRDRRNGDMAACEDPRSTCHTSHMLPQPLGKSTETYWVLLNTISLLWENSVYHKYTDAVMKIWRQECGGV